MSMKLTIGAAAFVAAIVGPTLAAGCHAGHHGEKTRTIEYIQRSAARASMAGVLDGDACEAFESPPGFAECPTDDLMNRFGDQPLRGR
jgi:hypothetical protein